MLNHKTAVSWKIVSAFAIGGLFAGLILAWIVSRPTLHSLWFRYQEYWILPTSRFSFLAGGLFFLSLASACFIGQLRNWLPFSKRRLIMGLAVLAPLPLLAWLVEPIPRLLQFFVFRGLLVLLLTAALLIVTRKWYWGLASLMFAASLATPLIGSLPYLAFESVSPEWFQISEYLFGFLLLSVLFSYWLVKSIRRINADSAI